ncbi:toprim domain-containing protein [Methylobacterium oxalidis]|uniref:toprim domain-containing protein n=1 Tax=Methylobacterium oxalidis TaxID=944322 RepID=UPI00331566A4
MSDLDAILSDAAARLNLRFGEDGVWRGKCPCCGYSKPTLALSVLGGGIAISCVACGGKSAIAAVAGIPSHLVVPTRCDPAKIARALQIWGWTAPASGTPVEPYLLGRGITEPIPPSIRFLRNQRNWSDGKSYAAMVSLVEQVSEDDTSPNGRWRATGIHLTFLAAADARGRVCKAAVETNKLALGQLRHGGVRLSSRNEVGQELVVAEGIETALSVQQLIGLPTVSVLSASGLKSFRWPTTVRRIWIAADNDAAGLQAAEHLRARALRAGIEARIKIPSGGHNDFNDLVKGQ